jgi:periplasmic protein TonB
MKLTFMRLLPIISLVFILLFSSNAFSQSTPVAKPEKDTTIELTTVQVEAQFPGGMQAWKKYLEKNLDVDIADKCIKIPKGQKMAKQTVIVSFKVDREGNISEAVAENGSKVCPQLAAEAVRVIKNGPQWVPATQNGRTVIYRQRQSITWVVTAE